MITGRQKLQYEAREKYERDQRSVQHMLEKLQKENAEQKKALAESQKGLTPILPGVHQRHIFPLGILHNQTDSERPGSRLHSDQELPHRKIFH